MAKYKVFENPNNGHQVEIKDGFNWVILFFGPIWYLLNGMIGKGLGLLLLAIVLAPLTFGIGSIIVWIVAGKKGNKEKENLYLEKNYIYKGYR